MMLHHANLILNPAQFKAKVFGFDQVTKFDRIVRVNFFIKKIKTTLF
jgi:hypothetical protein